jgi:hypothetical protein
MLDPSRIDNTDSLPEAVKVHRQSFPVRPGRFHADANVNRVTIPKPGRQLLESFGSIWKHFLRVSMIAEQTRVERLLGQVDS